MNSLRQALGGNAPQQVGFREFARQWTPQAAEAKVRELLSSGQMSQQQYRMLGEQARNLMGANAQGGPALRG